MSSQRKRKRNEFERPVENPAHRKSRKYPTEFGTITLTYRDAIAEFKCPICLQLMSKPTLVMECLHRFCKGCINTALRTGKKRCPSCRTKCPSHRHLRFDESLDKLINTLFPDRALYESNTEDIVTSPQDVQDEISRARIKQQMKSRLLKNRNSTKGMLIPKRKNNENPSAKDESAKRKMNILIPVQITENLSQNKKLVGRTFPDRIGFLVRRSPRSSVSIFIKFPLFKTQKSATIKHVQKLIAKELNQVQNVKKHIVFRDVNIFIGNREWYDEGKFKVTQQLTLNQDKYLDPLLPSLSLEDIFWKMWPTDTIIDFLYDLRKKGIS